MESGISNKLKVVWICHFSNEEIRQKLPLSDRKLLKSIKSLIRKDVNHSYNDFAPWITNLIKEFEKFDDVELHIIAPFPGLKNLTFEFNERGIFYHFFKPDLPIIHSEIPSKLSWRGKRNFLQNKFLVKRFIKKINPDLINLIGTENPYYSSTILNIKNKPIYVSAQTVYTNPDRKRFSDSCIQLNWDVELKIHQKEIYYGVTGRMHRDLILKNNPNAIIFKMFFPIEKPKQVEEFIKKYDFVFFAGLDKKKGIEDLLDALTIVKKYKNDVTLNIIGNTTESYKLFLTNKIKNLELEENIIFNDYFAKHSEMHQHLMYSKFSVLPIKLDVIPGSVIESMLLGLPVITYKTSGTPYLNKDGETVLIGDIGDIQTLADNMIKLIEDPALGNKLKGNAKIFVEKAFNNADSAKRLLSNYKAVIAHYNQKTPIPKEQLFNIDEFPLY